MEQKYKPRWMAAKLRSAVEFSPVIVLSGARQAGKSTLLRNEPPFKDWNYVTFDDLDSLALARRRPDELLNISSQLIIDEVQKAPAFLHAVKKAVDHDRTRRIVLSGSARIMLMKNVSESLAGRAVYVDLWPFSYGELNERPYDGWMASFMETGRLAASFQASSHTHQPVRDPAFSLFRGFLPPVTLLEKEEHVATWWKGYVKAYLERDLRDVSNIANLPDFRKLMELLALRNAAILRQSDLARDAGLSQATAGRYINILEETGLISRVRPYSGNISKRIIKSPKIIVTDPGLATSLARFQTTAEIPEPFQGSLLESYVYLNLMATAGLMNGEVMYFRTQGGREREVDFILERGRKILGIEVKRSQSVSLSDADNLLFLKEATTNFAGGLLVYAGTEVRQLTQNIYAIPWFCL